MKHLLLGVVFLVGVAVGTDAQTWTTLTNIMNLRGVTDENGALVTYASAAGAVNTPLTPLGNLRGRTDSNGALNITVAGGTITPGIVGHTLQVVTVDGATTFAVTSDYVGLVCTGAETINTITGGVAGMRLLIHHTDTDCTIADDDAATAADAVDLTGTGTNDAGLAKKVLLLLYNGTSWEEIAESDN